jgi:hypothetical protein
MRQNGSGQNISAQARGLFAGDICDTTSAGQSMFGFKRNKEAERFYLLPGQGGQAYRRKQKFLLAWAVIVGLAVSVALVALMYYLNKSKP